MKISYAVTTHQEHEEISRLIPFLLEHKDDEDELVIVDDYSDYKCWETFDKVIHREDVTFVEHQLNNDFAVHKNFLNSQCTGDWIVNIDADEMPNKCLMENIKPLIETNPTIELYWVPRVNTVDGITPEHVRLWGWNVGDNGWVNFPDPQQRIYKNSDHIQWVRPVHERLIGAGQDAYLPFEEEWSFYHHKTINKQEQQNKHYEGILK
jgi:glycosyltransferase involved in cell wall biosynthesis